MDFNEIIDFLGISEEVDEFLDDPFKMNYFEFESGLSEPLVKSRLKNALPFWETELNAPREVLKIIAEGYEIEFVEPPPRMHFKNNRSALENSDFVEGAIDELLRYNLIQEYSEPPFVISPLSVAENNGKKRLILDLSKLNDFIKQERIVLEDGKDFFNLAQNVNYVSSFDLKSAYHQGREIWKKLLANILAKVLLQKSVQIFSRIFSKFLSPGLIRSMYVQTVTLILDFLGNLMV